MIARLVLQSLATTGTRDRVSIDDVEARFRQLLGDATATVEGKKTPIIGGSVLALVVVLLLVYFVGRYRGARRATVLEIRKIV